MISIGIISISDSDRKSALICASVCVRVHDASCSVLHQAPIVAARSPPFMSPLANKRRSVFFMHDGSAIAPPARSD